LRTKKGLIALDNFDEGLCVFRCLAVHYGAYKKYNLRKTKTLATEFFSVYVILNEIVEFQHITLIAKYFNQEIIVYDVSPEGVFALKGWFKDDEEKEEKNPPMTIGIFEVRAFLITDLEKATNTYACAHCDASVTQSCSLLRHAERCTKGQAKIKCPGEKLFDPESLFERAFFPKGRFGIKACCWLEYESRQRGIHIHHHAYGHGGERVIAKHPVDGYHRESKTVFQYHGCHFHGCRKCYPSPKERELVICEQKEKGRMVPITREKAYQMTLRRNSEIQAAGYKLVVRWEHERPRPWWNDRLPKNRNDTFPHAIVFDFESFQDPTKRTVATKDLVFENEHIPVSVSLADTLNREPEHISSKHPQELVRKSWEVIVRRGEVLREDIKQKYIPTDFELLPKKQQLAMNKWRKQIPVVGFNSGKYDLNLIKKYFVTHVWGENNVTVAKKQEKIMFLTTPNFKSFDIINYLGPGTSYKNGSKHMEAVRQNRGYHTSSSTARTN